jgi:isopenicillin N synthase-like dioxygenase
MGSTFEEDSVKEKVPIIDIAPLWQDDGGEQFRDPVRAIDAACRRWGFFQVVNHGVPDVLIQRVWNETHRFFALERDVKLSIARTKKNPRGYYDRELTKNARDLKEVFDFARAPHPEHPDDDPKNRSAVDGHNQWPSALPGFKSTMVEYFAACERLGLTLLEAMCRGLGLPGDTLRAPFARGHTSFVRLNYYPLDDPLDPVAAATATDLGDMALHHHTDAGALTILLQDDVGGLQVQSGEEWIDVEPVAGAFVINVGDMMQVWSNDRYQAALHRVRPIRERARYSIPFFFNPSYDTDYAPLPSAAGERPRYRAINWGTFRQQRTDGDFADYGREVQITDYRID